MNNHQERKNREELADFKKELTQMGLQMVNISGDDNNPFWAIGKAEAIEAEANLWKEENNGGDLNNGK